MAPVCFLDLAGEIRNEIYHYYFESIRSEHFASRHDNCEATRVSNHDNDTLREVYFPHCPPGVWALYAQIFYTSRQVYAESKALFFQDWFPKHRFRVKHDQLRKYWEYFGRPKSFTCSYGSWIPLRPPRDTPEFVELQLEVVAAGEGFASVKEMIEEVTERRPAYDLSDEDGEELWPKDHVCRGPKSKTTFRLSYDDSYRKGQSANPEGFSLNGDVGGLPWLENLLALETEENLATVKNTEEEERWALNERVLDIKAKVTMMGI